MQKLKTSEYWSYVSALLENTRSSHRALHGTVLHRDNPFWKKNYPPNEWNCKCKVRAYSEAALKRRGLSVTDSTPNDIASKDWAYDLGAGSRVSAISKMDLDDLISNYPKTTDVKNPDGKLMTGDELKASFYKELGVNSGDTYIDKTGDPMVINDELFTRSISRYTKIKDQGRDLYMTEIAKTIAQPDEIYLYHNNEKKRLEKKMWRYLQSEQGKKRAILIVFEYLSDKTQGITAYFIKDAKQVENRRNGKLIYQKGQE